MAILDDGLLKAVVRQAGDSFGISPTGVSEILRRVNTDDDGRSLHGDAGDAGDASDASDAGDERSEPVSTIGNVGAVRTARPAPTARSAPTVRATARAHRVLSVAAAVLVLLAVGGGAVVLGHRTPDATRRLRAALATPSGHVASGAGSAADRPGTPASSGVDFGPNDQAASTPGSTDHAPAPAGAATGTSARAGATSDAPATTSQAASLPAGIGHSARIEQTGSLDLAVARGALSTTVNQLTALAGANGGFVADSQTRAGTSTSGPGATVTIEVPVASFSAVLKKAESFGKVAALTTQASDVTGQYVDLQDRITALQASRQQYLTIMSRAYSISDVLAVQAQLDALQSQIEQLQGQLALLGNETAYSSLRTGMTEPAPPRRHRAVVVPSGVARAWHDSVHGFVSGAEGLIRIAGPALFALLCLGVTLLGGQLFWRRLQRHNL